MPEVEKGVPGSGNSMQEGLEAMTAGHSSPAVLRGGDPSPSPLLRTITCGQTRGRGSAPLLPAGGGRRDALHMFPVRGQRHHGLP